MSSTGSKRILFQGDSITDGGRSRNEDLNHVMGHGYAYLVASRLGADYPGKNYTFLNRGVSGNRVVDLYARWKEDALNLRPDVLSILVGVNDVRSEFVRQSGVPADRYERTYRLLLEDTKIELPECKLVVCEPFALPSEGLQAYWEDMKTELGKRQKIVKKLAEEYEAAFIPLQEEFLKVCEAAPVEYWLWDGFHPTPAGHELIAREWVKAVQGQQILP